MEEYQQNMDDTLHYFKCKSKKLLTIQNLFISQNLVYNVTNFNMKTETLRCHLNDIQFSYDMDRYTVASILFKENIHDGVGVDITNNVTLARVFVCLFFFIRLTAAGTEDNQE